MQFTQKLSNVYRNLKQIMGPLVFDVMFSKIQLFGDFCHKVRQDFGLFFYHKVYKILTYLLYDVFKKPALYVDSKIASKVEIG